MNKRYKSNQFKKVPYLLVLVIVLLSVGYSAFGTDMNLSNIVAKIRLKKDVRISNVMLLSSEVDANSSYQEYNVNRLIAGVTLPEADSTITFSVGIVNLGNVEAGILKINNLPDVLDYEFIDYNLKDKICDKEDSTKCSLGASSEIKLKIKYKDSTSHDSSNTSFSLDLELDIKPFYTVSYTNITNNGYPTELLGGNSLTVNFGDAEFNFLKVLVDDKVTYNYSFTDGILTIPNVTGNVEIMDEAPMYLANLRIDGNTIQNGIPSIENPVPLESVGDKTENILDLSKVVTSSSTSHVTFNYSNETGTIEYTNTPTSYDYLMLYLQRDLGFQFEEGKTYYYGADIIVEGKQTTNETTINFGVTYTGDPNWHGLEVTKNGTYHKEGSFVYNSQENIRMLLHANYGSDEPAKVTFKNLYFGEINEFDQYNKYKIPIQVSGKNLFNNDTSLLQKITYVGSSGSSASRIGYKLLLPAGTYTAHAEGMANSNYIYGVINSEDGQYKSGVNLVVHNNLNTITFTINEGDILYIYNGSSSLDMNIAKKLFESFKIQIEENTTATSYEPYMEIKTYNIYLDEPLRKIGDMYDYLDLNTGQVVRNIYGEYIATTTLGKSSLTGTYSIFLITPSKELYVEKPTSVVNDTIGFAMSNKFKKHDERYGNLVRNGGYIQTYKTSAGDSRVAFSFADSTINTIELAQEKLGDGMDVNYVLASPITETIEVPTNIKFNGYSVVKVNTEIVPSNITWSVE